MALRRSSSDKRRPNQWDLPGGRVEEGEDIQAAAIRETKEESNLEVSDVRLVYGMSDNLEKYGSGTWVVFSGTAKTSDVQISDEHSEYTWFSLEEAIEKFEYDRINRTKICH